MLVGAKYTARLSIGGKVGGTLQLQLSQAGEYRFGVEDVGGAD